MQVDTGVDYLGNGVDVDTFADSCTLLHTNQQSLLHNTNLQIGLVQKSPHSWHQASEK